jgi:hypothetical protein
MPSIRVMNCCKESGIGSIIFILSPHCGGKIPRAAEKSIPSFYAIALKTSSSGNQLRIVLTKVFVRYFIK